MLYSRIPSQIQPFRRKILIFTSTRNLTDHIPQLPHYRTVTVQPKNLKAYTAVASYQRIYSYAIGSDPFSADVRDDH